MTPAQRDYFDRLLEAILETLPEHVLDLFEEVPLVVDDEPDASLLAELDMVDEFGRPEELFGLHTGIPLTERSVEDHGRIPDDIRIFRGPLLRLAGHNERELSKQIRITLLHEIGHHFGLDEVDLDRLGYG